MTTNNTKYKEILLMVGGPIYKVSTASAQSLSPMKMTITMYSKVMIDNRKSNRKSKGQKELFEKIWNTRPHVCEKCGEYIKEAKVHNFAHIKPKGMYPELKFEESNIELLCFSCHFTDTTGLNYKGIDIG